MKNVTETGSDFAKKKTFERDILQFFLKKCYVIWIEPISSIIYDNRKDINICIHIIPHRILMCTFYKMRKLQYF